MADFFDVTASIVLYRNDRKILKQTIDSFLATELNVKLLLLDNSPTDDLKDLIVDQRVEYIFNNANIGFGAAHNIGIKKSLKNCKYYVVLNPDVYYDKGNLEKLVEFMDSKPEVGHVMPKILYPDGSMQFLCKRNPRPFDLFVRRFLPNSLKKYFKKRLDSYEYRNHDYNKTIFDIPYLSGCLMFFRTETLEKVGYFDDRIFMYIEDADITRRFLEVSRTAYYPEAVMYHHFAKGSHKSKKLMMYSIHGAIIYFNKWGWIFPKK